MPRSWAAAQSGHIGPNLPTRHKRHFAASGNRSAESSLLPVASPTGKETAPSGSSTAMDKVAKTSLWPAAVFLVLIGVPIIGIVLLLSGVVGPVTMPFRSFVIPSSGMVPTLHVGEYLFANMRAFDGEDPARGDVVVFRLPRDPSTIYVQRVIGLPGEKVQIKQGILHIDGQAVPTVDAGPYRASEDGRQERLKRETLPNGVSVTTLDMLDNGFYDNTPVYQVPPGH